MNKTDISSNKIGLLQKWLGYSYRVPLCVPYWNGATYRSLIRTFLMARVLKGPDIVQFENFISNYFSLPAGVISCVSGRVALELALHATGIKENQEVIIPTFCCVSIVEPILRIGARPVLADVGEDLNLSIEDIEAVFTKETAAVIVPHLFGNPADIEKIVEFCASKRVVVIDDAAQALGGFIGNRPLGTFGDAGIVSFGKGKVCFGTGGGVFITHNMRLLEKAKLIDLGVSRYSEGISNALDILVWRRWRQWTLPLQVVMSKLKFNKEQRGKSYLRQGLRNVDASVALSLLDGLGENLRKRRECVSLYQNLLGKSFHMSLTPHANGSSCLSQLVQFNPDSKGQSRVPGVLRNLRAKGFEVSASYTPLHLFSKYRNYAKGSLEKIEKRWEHLLELPCEPSVRMEDIELIACVIHETLEEKTI